MLFKKKRIRININIWFQILYVCIYIHRESDIFVGRRTTLYIGWKEDDVLLVLFYIYCYMKEDTTAYSLWLYGAKLVMLLSTMNIKQQIDSKVVYAETRSSAMIWIMRLFYVVA